MTLRIANLILYYTFSFCEKAPLETDVLVIGGGTSGVAAALSSARQGVKTYCWKRGHGWEECLLQRSNRR